MHTNLRPPVPTVLLQHAEDAAALRNTRAVLVRAPHVRLHLLQRLDERLAAHLDGLAVAGTEGKDICVAMLDRVDRGTAFAATVQAIETRDLEFLGRLLAIAQAEATAMSGVLSAFGWVEAASLRGITKELLDAAEPIPRDVGLAACAMHGVSPGAALESALQESTAPIRAMHVAAALGQTNLVDACRRHLNDTDPTHRFAAARAALLLGDRDAAPAVLREAAATDGPCRAPATLLLLKTLAPKEAQSLLRTLSLDAATVRLLIRGIGVAGDPHYIPWLLAQMADLRLARLAGEAFSQITGLDLAALDLDRKPPETAVSGPSDNPGDDDVAMDEDDSLPWPDPDKLGVWWRSNGARFAAGVRYFVGEPPSTAHCLSVLRTGFQRQRSAAAEYLCLLAPGTRLFNVMAPAWRQQRQLARMAL